MERPLASDMAVPLLDARVLVVVPTLNEAVHIVGVLERLLRDAAGFTAARVVVVDGGSTDQTVELVEALALRHDRLYYLPNPARIQSAAVNLAARRFGAEADVLVRCDAHADYPEGYCVRLVQTLQRVHADAVVVPMDSVGSTPLQRAVAWASNSLLGTGGAKHRGGRESGFVDHGHHAAFRMTMFRQCGGYDETFSHNEDAEFDCRQLALGARVYLDGDARLSYHPRSTLTALSSQYFRYGAGRSRTVRRHPGSLRMRQLVVPVHVLATATALLLAPWEPALLAWPALYLLALALASLTLAGRHRSWAGLLAGPAAAVMHFSWGAGFLAGLFRWRERVWNPEMVVPLGEHG